MYTRKDHLQSVRLLFLHARRRQPILQNTENSGKPDITSNSGYKETIKG